MIEQLKFLFNKNPSYFIFWVTQGCNFTCDHCFNFEENQKKNHDLTLAEIDQFSSRLDHVKYITIAGGEPFIRRDLAKIAEIFYRNNALQMLNVVTNGWFTQATVDFARVVLEQCPKLALSVAISIDGPRDVHDSIRQKVGSFDRCIETIGELKKLQTASSRLSVLAGGTYHAGNASSILGFAKGLIQELQIPFLLNLIRGNVQNNQLKHIDIAHYRTVQGILQKINTETWPEQYPFGKLRVAVGQTVTDMIYDSFQNNKMTAPCQAGKQAFVVTANGDILLCEILNIRLGNLRQYAYDAMAILRSEQAISEMKKIKESRCHCTWECFQTINAVFSLKVYPKIFGHLVKNAIPTPKPLSIAGSEGDPCKEL